MTIQKLRGMIFLLLRGHFTDKCGTKYFRVEEEDKEYYIRTGLNDYKIVERNRIGSIITETRNKKSFNTEMLDIQAVFMKEEEKVKAEYLLILFENRMEKESMNELNKALRQKVMRSGHHQNKTKI